MGVKVKKIRGSWYLVINYKGHRKTKKIGNSLEIAREVARKVEGRLAQGDMGIFGEDDARAVIFSEYADRWLKKHIEINTKPATLALYKWLMDCHILPYFGKQRVSAVTAERVEDFVYALATKKENGQCVHAQKTISLIVGCLRSFFTYAVKHKVATSNPASCLGRMVKSDKPAREIESMTQRESELFLDAVRDLFPERYPLFLTALRTGMRRGELIGLKWGDCAFGKDENDPNRYFMVSRQFTVYGFETPKTIGSKRRVDMSRQLRAVLLELREARMLAAMQLGTDESFSEQLLFPREDGEPLTPRTIGLRFMDPACQAAGIQRFTPHCLRHTFAVLMIQSGASMKYVSEQLGHSSIKITADVYGRLQPSANVSLIDRLDSPAPLDANQAQTQGNAADANAPESIDTLIVVGDSKRRETLIAY
ncbi:MAG: site-specific integrase [Acidobacteriia bacterium]|nr:site-specific integrase [Terriglobia bacterium]